MAQLRKLDVGGGEGIPSLGDLFSLIEKYRPKIFNIELKGAETYEVASRQTRAFCARSGYPHDHIIYSSFDHDQLKKLRVRDAGAKIGLLFEVTAEGPQPLYPETGPAGDSIIYSRAYVESVMGTIKPTSLHPLLEDATANLHVCARDHKLDILAWTMNEKPPTPDSAVATFARRHADDPYIHLITDFPVEVVRACDANVSAQRSSPAQPEANPQSNSPPPAAPRR
jgi:glycerophosphoryl diester phosphodiesterase